MDTAKGLRPVRADSVATFLLDWLATIMRAAVAVFD